MTKKISAFALMACLATSFAFAAESNKRASADTAKTETAQTASTQQASCPTKDNKNQKNAKTAPSTQEQEFDKVLQGIHG